MAIPLSANMLLGEKKLTCVSHELGERLVFAAG